MKYEESKKQYRAMKDWLMQNLDSYINNKSVLHDVENGNYPDYIKRMSIEKIERHMEKIRKTVEIYDIFAHLVHEMEDYGYNVIARN